MKSITSNAWTEQIMNRPGEQAGVAMRNNRDVAFGMIYMVRNT